jgi:hypothetical protein
VSSCYLLSVLEAEGLLLVWLFSTPSSVYSQLPSVGCASEIWGSASPWCQKTFKALRTSPTQKFERPPCWCWGENFDQRGIK